MAKQFSTLMATIFRFGMEAGKFISKMLVRPLSKLFLSAIFFVALAYFIPDFRESMPSFYRVADFIIFIFEKMWEFVISIFI